MKRSICRIYITKKYTPDQNNKYVWCDVQNVGFFVSADLKQASHNVTKCDTQRRHDAESFIIHLILNPVTPQ